MRSFLGLPQAEICFLIDHILYGKQPLAIGQTTPVDGSIYRRIYSRITMRAPISRWHSDRRELLPGVVLVNEFSYQSALEVETPTS